MNTSIPRKKSMRLPVINLPGEVSFAHQWTTSRGLLH
jgi:hypothetical protein